MRTGSLWAVLDRSTFIGDFLGLMADIKLEVVMPFIEATKEIFDTMAQIKTRRKDVYLKSGYGMFGDVSGVIGLSGKPGGRVR